MKKLIKKGILIILLLYLGLCVFVYNIQEKIIFFPEKLSKNHVYHFERPFKEMSFQMPDGEQLNGVLFKVNKASKGLIFYLHGNAGSIQSIGGAAKTYTDLGYDLLMMDYRGFGKSTGKITSETQLFDDLQLVYKEMKQLYSEDRMVVLGYSIGTGMAAKIASVHHPKKLILEAPYYSLTDLMRRKYPFLPTFILKYPLSTNEYLANCNLPITIFHGQNDKTIYPGSSVKLKKEFSDKIQLILLENQGHDHISSHPKFRIELQKILAN